MTYSTALHRGSSEWAARDIARQVWREEVALMKPRWKREAERCIAKHSLVVFNWEGRKP